jgi:heptosyltransferase II
MNILVVKLASIGDVLVSTPFFRLLKEVEPKSRIGHLVMSQCRFVTKNNPYIDYHIDLKPIKLKNLFNLIFSSFIIFLKVRSENPDIIFLFHNNIFLRFLLRISSKAKMIGFYRGNSIFLSTGAIQSLQINRSIEEYNLIKASGVNITLPQRIEYYANKNNIKYSYDLPTEFILCNPGGGNIYSDVENRAWPIEKYAELIDRSVETFIILGSGEKDLQRAKNLEMHCSKRFINLVGKTNFDEVNDLLLRAKLYIGNDSSLMFLASSSQCKSLILFGPTQESAALPIGFNGEVIRSGVGCSPCYSPEDGVKGVMYTCDDNICMKKISVNEVIKKIDKLINPELILHNDN